MEAPTVLVLEIFRPAEVAALLAVELAPRRALRVVGAEAAWAGADLEVAAAVVVVVEEAAVDGARSHS